jgi:hypothetical protein
MGKRSPIFIFHRMQITGPGEGGQSFVGTECARHVAGTWIRLHAYWFPDPNNHGNLLTLDSHSHSKKISRKIVNSDCLLLLLVSLETRWIAGVRFPVGARHFTLAHMSRETRPPIQWGRGGYPFGIKQSGSEADRALLFNSEVYKCQPLLSSGQSS